VLDRPDIDDAVLLAAVRDGWAIDATAVTFLPVGLDGAAWAYRVGDHFLKVRSTPAEVWLPQYLRGRGLTAVVAPLPTADGRPWHRAGGHQLLLYPFINSHDLWQPGLTDEQWIAYGRFLAELHATPPPGGLPVETFRTTAPDRVRESTGAASPYLDEFWQRHGARYAALADEVDRLAAAVPQDRPTVICHADIHPGNLLADRDGALHVVDWDAPIRAPRERDLMFVFGSDFGAHPADERRAALFRRGYGDYLLDLDVLAYYLHERIADDAALAVASIAGPTGSDAANRYDLHWLTQLFVPGGAMDRAAAVTRDRTVT